MNDPKLDRLRQLHDRIERDLRSERRALRFAVFYAWVGVVTRYIATLLLIAWLWRHL